MVYKKRSVVNLDVSEIPYIKMMKHLEEPPPINYVISAIVGVA